MPGLEHRKGEQGGTALTLDPFLSIPAGEQLLIRWDAGLTDEQRSVLGKLAELLPYLGRSESVCQAQLLDDEVELDESWWRPSEGGQTRLLAVSRPVTRAVLEATTTDVRKQRRTVPPGTTWVSYAAGNVADLVTERPRDEDRGVAAIRFAVMGPVDMKATHGVLLADRAHEMAAAALTDAGIPDSRRRDILGTKGADTDHLHAHWIALPDSANRGASVRNLIIWVKRELGTDEVRTLLSLRQLSGRRGKYKISGFPEVQLRFQAAGPIGQVAPELCEESARWVSRTPYLPVRHRKRQAIDEFLVADIAAELRYRDLPEATVSRLDPRSELTDRWGAEFRRYRIRERLAQEELAPDDKRVRRPPPRPGLGLRLEFEEPVAGPLLLGQLSHFGYGIFVPEEP
jgi:CRISPR-associated protein Csb2